MTKAIKECPNCGLRHPCASISSALKAHIEGLEKALKFYGDRDNYLSGDFYINGMTRPVMQDFGKTARNALHHQVPIAAI